MRYFVRIRDNPSAKNYNQPLSLHRLGKEGNLLIVQRWCIVRKKWVDNVGMVKRFSGLGGADDFRQITEPEARALLRQWSSGDGPRKADGKTKWDRRRESEMDEAKKSTQEIQHNVTGPSSRGTTTSTIQRTYGPLRRLVDKDYPDPHCGLPDVHGGSRPREECGPSEEMVKGKKVDLQKLGLTKTEIDGVNLIWNDQTSFQNLDDVMQETFDHIEQLMGIDMRDFTITNDIELMVELNAELAEKIRSKANEYLEDPKAVLTDKQRESYEKIAGWDDDQIVRYHFGGTAGVYYDEYGFLFLNETTLPKPGSKAFYYTLAHETGHHVSYLAGRDWTPTRAQRLYEEFETPFNPEMLPRSYKDNVKKFYKSKQWLGEYQADLFAAYISMELGGYEEPRFGRRFGYRKLKPPELEDMNDLVEWLKSDLGEELLLEYKAGEKKVMVLFPVEDGLYEGLQVPESELDDLPEGAVPENDIDKVIEHILGEQIVERGGEGSGYHDPHYGDPPHRGGSRERGEGPAPDTKHHGKLGKGGKPLTEYERKEIREGRTIRDEPTINLNLEDFEQRITGYIDEWEQKTGIQIKDMHITDSYGEGARMIMEVARAKHPEMTDEQYELARQKVMRHLGHTLGSYNTEKTVLAKGSLDLLFLNNSVLYDMEGEHPGTMDYVVSHELGHWLHKRLMGGDMGALGTVHTPDTYRDYIERHGYNAKYDYTSHEYIADIIAAYANDQDYFGVEGSNRFYRMTNEDRNNTEWIMGKIKKMAEEHGWLEERAAPGISAMAFIPWIGGYYEAISVTEQEARKMRGRGIKVVILDPSHLKREANRDNIRNQHKKDRRKKAKKRRKRRTRK